MAVAAAFALGMGAGATIATLITMLLNRETRRHELLAARAWRKRALSAERRETETLWKFAQYVSEVERTKPLADVLRLEPQATEEVI